MRLTGSKGSAWIAIRDFLKATSRTDVMRKRLWLHKITHKCGRENVMVEHSRSLYVAIATFLDAKASIDSERIVVVVDDATHDHLSRKTAPQSSEIPFAAQNI